MFLAILGKARVTLCSVQIEKLRTCSNDVIFFANFKQLIKVGWSGRLGSADVSFIYIEWINNKVLLYSTGNYIQYPMINLNGKEY